jgi:hypothetical protein
LVHDPERKLMLELGTASAQDAQSGPSGKLARRVRQGALAGSRRTLYEDGAAAAPDGRREYLAERIQLFLTFEQPLSSCP